MDRTQRDGVLLVLVSAAGYAFFLIFSKSVFDAGLSPLDLLEWRFLIAVLLIWLLTVLLAVVVRNETLVALQMLGGALILLSVIVLQTQRLQPRRLVMEPAGD